ncbi:hypothetical protein DFJ73DRAFT_812930 [Zopfochytrium polystomum]|nr:hypothetical protein DFJ73DRAFT_812930 [Zopfochytrium polystomum]
MRMYLQVGPARRQAPANTTATFAGGRRGSVLQHFVVLYHLFPLQRSRPAKRSRRLTCLACILGTSGCTTLGCCRTRTSSASAARCRRPHRSQSGITRLRSVAPLGTSSTTPTPRSRSYTLPQTAPCALVSARDAPTRSTARNFSTPIRHLASNDTPYLQLAKLAGISANQSSTNPTIYALSVCWASC